MAASLRLGRQGILLGLKFSNFNKCFWATQPWQEHVRHLFLSPWTLGECWQLKYKGSFCPCVWWHPRTIVTFVCLHYFLTFPNYDSCSHFSYHSRLDVWALSGPTWRKSLLCDVKHLFPLWVLNQTDTDTSLKEKSVFFSQYETIKFTHPLFILFFRCAFHTVWTQTVVLSTTTTTTEFSVQKTHPADG